MRKLLHRLRDERGFTLSEMIMVCAYLGVVLGGITAMMLAGSHSALNLNRRFSAQETARVALTTFRNDAHAACAASVSGTGGTSVSLSVPSSSPTTTCGVSGTTKILYCVLTSPTASTEYALYRSTSSSCSSSSKLIADDLVGTLSGFSAYFSTSSTIAYGMLQVIDVDFGVKIPSGSAGTSTPYRLTERIGLRQSVWPSSGSTCSSTVACNLGVCTTAGGCTVPTIS